MRAGLLHFNQRVLDYGCGRGADVRFLQAHGFNVQGFDPWFAPNPPTGSFDVILCSYVLNVIPERNDRLAALQEIKGKLTTAQGRVLTTTRSQSQVDALAKKSNWTRHLDGYVTPKNTFQRGYNMPELIKFHEEAGWRLIQEFLIKDAACGLFKS